MMYFIHNILTNMFRPAFRPSSGWCSYTRIQKYKCGYPCHYHSTIRTHENRYDLGRDGGRSQTVRKYY